MNERARQQVIDAIVEEMRSMGELVVALSGGVDSSVVAALAHRALGERALAATAVSETLAGRELDEARAIAAEIGVRHATVPFRELSDERFVENTSERCFFCQSMRFDQMRALADKLGYAHIASGSNASDRGEHRPGMRAMSERGVYQPLLDHGVDKDGVRAIARALGLSVWDKPAAACLSSRIPHGTAVTEERLRRIERAEEAVRALGYRGARVRDHKGIARVEIAPAEIPEVWTSEALAALRDGVESAGFERVVVDMEGYRAGSVSGASYGKEGEDL